MYITTKEVYISEIRMKLTPLGKGGDHADKKNIH